MALSKSRFNSEEKKEINEKFMCIVASLKNRTAFDEQWAQDADITTKYVLTKAIQPTKKAKHSHDYGIIGPERRPRYMERTKVLAWILHAKLCNSKLTDVAFQSQISTGNDLKLVTPHQMFLNSIFMKITESMLIPLELKIFEKLQELEININVHIDIFTLRKVNGNGFSLGGMAYFLIPRIIPAEDYSRNWNQIKLELQDVVAFIKIEKKEYKDFLNQIKDNEFEKYFFPVGLSLGVINIGPTHPKNQVVKAVKLMLNNHKIELKQ